MYGILNTLSIDRLGDGMLTGNIIIFSECFFPFSPDTSWCKPLYVEMSLLLLDPLRYAVQSSSLTMRRGKYGSSPRPALT